MFPTLFLGRDLGIVEKGAVFAAAIGLSYFSWKYIETPLRKAPPGAPRKLALAGMAAGTLGLCAISGLIIATHGVPSRMTPQAQTVFADITKPTDQVSHCKPINDFKPDRGMPVTSCEDETLDSPNQTFILWGDSHAGMLWQDITLHLDTLKMSGILASLSDCPALLDVHTFKRKNRDRCARLGVYLQDLVKARDIPVVILASRWGNYSSDLKAPGDGSAPKELLQNGSNDIPVSFHQALSQTVESFTKLGAHVVVVGPVPEINFDVPEMLIRSVNLNFPLPDVSFDGFTQRQANTLEALKGVSGKENVTVVYPHIKLCSQEQCTIVDGTQPLYDDDDHLSEKGVSLILPAILSAIVSIQPVTH